MPPTLGQTWQGGSLRLARHGSQNQGSVLASDTVLDMLPDSCTGGGTSSFSVANPGCLSRVPDPNLFHSGSRIQIFSISEPHQLFIPDPDLGCGSWFFTHPRSRGQKDTGSRIPDPDPQHCLLPFYDMYIVQVSKDWVIISRKWW